MQLDIFYKHVILHTNWVTCVFSGLVNYTVYTGGRQVPVTVAVEVVDVNGNVVASSNVMHGQLTVADANLWWPYTMNSSSPGYMYTLKVTQAPRRQLCSLFVIDEQPLNMSHKFCPQNALKHRPQIKINTRSTNVAQLVICMNRESKDLATFR